VKGEQKSGESRSSTVNIHNMNQLGIVESISMGNSLDTVDESPFTQDVDQDVDNTSVNVTASDQQAWDEMNLKKYKDTEV